jgi:hypothetical protein
METIRILMLVFLLVFTTPIYAQQEEKLIPKKVELDSNFDGVVDRIEYYDDNGEVTRVESDTNYDGRYDEWVYYENGKVVKAEKDTNSDGSPDTWIEY